MTHSVMRGGGGGSEKGKGHKNVVCWKSDTDFLRS